MTCHIIDFRQASTSPLNPLGAQLRRYIADQIQQALQQTEVTSIVLTGGPQHFSAGADLTEFGKSMPGPSLINVVSLIENCRKPVVACISGTALGGGLEVALACHYRVAGPKARMGLPEVHVGVIPGAGGTQRLPRLVGLATATEMILTGAPVAAPQALRMKLVDEVVEDPSQLVAKAVAWASWAEVMPLRRLGQIALSEHPAMVHNILHVAALSLPNNDGSLGFKAAIEALRASSLPLEEGMQVEFDCFMRTLTSRQGQARRHNFFAVRQAQKPYAAVPWNKQHALLDKSQTAQTAVIGAGTMGGGIALVLLQAGFAVTLVDVKPDFLAKGVEKLRNIVQTQVKRKRMMATVAQAMLQRLKTTTQLNDLKGCQLVVEAVVENLPIKQKIFRQLDAILAPDALLLSNTSTLSIDAMASAVTRRGRFAGWHFFSPAHLMKLVEIVVGQETAPETVMLLQALTKRIGKTGVVVGNCDGFCGNRLLRPYSAEMVMVVVEGGATPRAVDDAIRNFGMAMGPFEMADLAGNDVGYNIRKERGWVRSTESEPIPPKRPARYTELADILIANYGRLGQKVGKGWYDYDPAIGKGRTPLPSREVDAVVKQYVQQSRRTNTLLTPEQIIERILYPLVNEGFKCLEEGIVQRPSDIDVVYVYGYGFPVWRGGPMNWADQEVGLPHLLHTLQKLAREFPETDHYQPSALLEKCVRVGTTVEEYYKTQTRSKL